MTEKPQFVLEVEQTLGLECLHLLSEADGYSEWWVVTPTDFQLFRIGGKEDKIGMISQPDMFNIQGISNRIRNERRKGCKLPLTEKKGK